MTRNIISKFIIVLIILFTALGLFWFFKTSTIKKQTLAFIADSGGRISATSVSVSGFPLDQKLTIEGLKFQLSASLPHLPIVPASQQYQIEIKKLEAKASILSGEFIITNIEDVSYQDQTGTPNLVQFNQAPQANFVVSGGELTKFSYQDIGYKILDAGKNVLFENGSSMINFESAFDGNKYNNKVKVEFKDVGMFNSIVPSAPPAVGENVLPDAGVASSDSQVVAGSVAQPSIPNVAPANNDVPANVTGNLVKKNFVLDLEYVVSKSSSLEVPAPDAASDAANNSVVSNGAKLDSVNIKNFEISSPLYKVNINGEISSFQDDGFPISSISARIEKFDNVLIYLKKPLSDMASANTANTQDNAAKDGSVDNSNVAVNQVGAPISNAPTSDSATMPAANQKPEVDIISIIKELSKKNPATNDEIAVFDFRQEKGKDLLINETSLSEIIAQLFPFFVNNTANPVSSAAIPDGLVGSTTSNAPTPSKQNPSDSKVVETNVPTPTNVPASKSNNVH
jgi:hypothetical protein